MSISRRNFLRFSALGLGATTLLSSVERFGLGSALATTTFAPGYKALVIVFLFGGNDANNMLIPNDARYADYKLWRDDAHCDFGIPQPGTVGALNPAGIALNKKDGLGGKYMLHPKMPKLAALINAASSPAAILCNTGTLVEPTRKDPVTGKLVHRTSGAAVKLPLHLMSHLDQQREWQTSIANPDATQVPTGWGGRVADRYGSDFPTNVSESGAVLFTQGASTGPLVVSPTSPSGLTDLSGLSDANTNAEYVAALAGLSDPSSAVNALGESGAYVVRANQRTMQQALLNTQTLNTALANKAAVGAFGTGSLSVALQRIAEMISVSASIKTPKTNGMTRQIFFCGLGGFDTHAGQDLHQSALLGEIDDALDAFNTAMQLIGAQDKVVLATHSDFARTFKPASHGGTDHAWGSHHIILGGPVHGGIHGIYPDLQLGGPDDVDGISPTFDGEGRWVPTTSVDQYAATLAHWFDPALPLNALFPNLSNFGQQPLLPFL
jgi:uncharacterized protein (DUF1501 family)